MRASYLMSGVATGLRRNASMTVALVLSTAIALFFLGGALLINQEISKTQTAYKDKINVSIYLCTSTSNQTPGSPCKHAVTDSERQALQDKLNSDPQIIPGSVDYINQDEATAIAKQRLGAKVVDEAGPGAIPSSFTIRLKNLKTDYAPVAARYAAVPGVEQVQNQDVSLKTMLRLFETGRIGSYVMAIIVGLCAMLQMANTIQMAAAQRRNETGIMRLVGASRWMTQLPFVIEAMVAAAVGAVLAIIGNWIAKTIFLDGLLGDQVRSRILQPLYGNDILISGGIGLIAGVALAAVTAWVTLRISVRL
ncbi:MAG TPA: permease-like cell division protein FtsX [Jatrophihabitans sp.]|nr:permease-like cell division protein FtsX [Jatrophihabitans sp.]